MNQIHLGLQLMGYGILGIFCVLSLFILIIKVLLVVFPDNPQQKEPAAITRTFMKFFHIIRKHTLEERS